ncbi:MAG: radical SAM protein [Lachnospiraceae bacterium]|nr:radical SAM protein [Lachnospiraceae bacterium]
MKIVFIKVNMMYSKGRDALKPLVFALIEKLTPPEHELIFYDERIEALPDTLDADIIAFSVETFAARHAYELAEKYKRKDNLTVMGGFHPTAMEEEVLEHADIVLKGDAEDTWRQLMEDVSGEKADKSGFLPGHRIKRVYSSQNACHMSYVDPNSSCYRGKKYLPLAMIQASRGCKFNCDFCSIKSLYPGDVRQKETGIVVREIRESREKLVFFIDDNLFFDEESAKALFKAIKPLKKKWACQISLEIAFKDELLDMMYESGCFMVLIGLESLNEDNLRIMKKSANIGIMRNGRENPLRETGRREGKNAADDDIMHLEEALKNIYRHNIMIYGMFVLGYDHDTAGSIKDTYEFAMRNNLTVANFNPLMILPGTQLFLRMKEEGRLRFEKWWLDPSYRYGDAMYYPGSMSTEELRDGCKSARYDFNTWKNIFKRLLREKVNHRSLLNITVFLAINLISRSEIHRKQGKSL